jgi:hypothetical protein
MGGLNLTTGFIVQFILFQRLNLCLGQDAAFFGNLGLQGLQANLEVRQIMAQPDGTNAGR